MALTVEPFKTDRKRAITFPTLGNPTTWPKADSERCCIFEAINIVGSASYGSAWIGDELCAWIWPIAPKEAQARSDDRRATKAPPFVTQMHTAGAGRLIRPSTEEVEAADHHVEAWFRNKAALRRKLALEDEQTRWEMNRASLDRLTGAIEWLAQQCRDNRVTSYYRWRIGGQLVQMAPADWNIEFPLEKFAASGGYKRWFANAKPPAEYPVYIFFDRAAVEQAASMFSQRPKKVPIADLTALSPYLRFAIELAKSRDWAGVDATFDARCADVRAEWTSGMGDVPMSTLMVESIARVGAFPNPKAIRHGQMRGKPNKTGSSPKTSISQ